MTTLKKLWKWLTAKIERLIIIALVILCLFLSFCRGGDCPETKSDTLTLTDTIRDLRVCTTAVTGKPVVIHDTIELPAGEIDSLAVARAYFTRTEYNWILADDSSDYAQLNFSIYMNKPDSGEYIRINRRPLYITNTQIIDNTKPPRKWHFFVGASVGGSLSSFELAPGFLVQHKRFLTGINYGIVGKSINVPLYYEINFKRNVSKKVK